MPVIGLDHVQLAMPPGGEASACEFYGCLLGLAKVEKPRNLAARGGCWFQRGAVRVHLGVEVAFQPARKAHPALLVDDLDALAAVLEAAGHSTQPGEPLDGYIRRDVFDPFGNRVELMQHLAA